MDDIAEEIVVKGVLHEGKSIGYMTSLMLQPPLGHLGDSLERSDLARSREQYLNVLASCNTCHAAVGLIPLILHPIKPPSPLEPIALAPPLDPE